MMRQTYAAWNQQLMSAGHIRAFPLRPYPSRGGWIRSCESPICYREHPCDIHVSHCVLPGGKYLCPVHSVCHIDWGVLVEVPHPDGAPLIWVTVYMEFCPMSPVDVFLVVPRYIVEAWIISGWRNYFLDGMPQNTAHIVGRPAELNGMVPYHP